MLKIDIYFEINNILFSDAYLCFISLPVMEPFPMILSPGNKTPTSPLGPYLWLQRCGELLTRHKVRYAHEPHATLSVTLESALQAFIPLSLGALQPHGEQ